MSLLDQARRARRETNFGLDPAFVRMSVEARDALVELADANMAYWDAPDSGKCDRVLAALERLQR